MGVRPFHKYTLGDFFSAFPPDWKIPAPSGYEIIEVPVVMDSYIRTDSNPNTIIREFHTKLKEKLDNIDDLKDSLVTGIKVYEDVIKRKVFIYTKVAILQINTEMEERWEYGV